MQFYKHKNEEGEKKEKKKENAIWIEIQTDRKKKDK